MQLIKLSAVRGYAGKLCYPALLEALFVTAVVIGDELALPVSQEGAGMSACPAWGKVVNDGIEPFMYRRGIGPEVGPVCFSVFVRTQDLDGGGHPHARHAFAVPLHVRHRPGGARHDRIDPPNQPAWTGVK